MISLPVIYILHGLDNKIKYINIEKAPKKSNKSKTKEKPTKQKNQKKITVPYSKWMER